MSNYRENYLYHSDNLFIIKADFFDGFFIITKQYKVSLDLELKTIYIHPIQISCIPKTNPDDIIPKKFPNWEYEELDISYFVVEFRDQISNLTNKKIIEQQFIDFLHFHLLKIINLRSFQ